MKIRTAALAVLALLGGAFALSSCLTAPESAPNACANLDVFQQSVSPYMERRCATLDCHGSIARPMRLYGQLGLRHANQNNIPGGKATTQLELDANYISVCNIEPERMTASIENLGNDAEQLLIVRKARGDIKHKGGQVVSGDGNDPGDLCIVKWLQLAKPADVAAQCKLAVDKLNP